MQDVTLAIIIPTFNRADKLERAAKNAHDNTTVNHNLYFVVEPGDWHSYNEAKRIREHVIISSWPGNHTGAANTAYLETFEPFFILANDDFNFHPGWDTLALAKMTEGIGVVGVNDGMNNYTPITLVRRSYIQEQSGSPDTKNTLYFPGYNHNYVDTEFSEVAKKRGVFVECPESIVEHMHYTFNKSPMDKTYEKSKATASLDQATYEFRKHLWQ